MTMTMVVKWTDSGTSRTYKGLRQSEVNKLITYISELQEYGEVGIFITVKS